MNLHSSIRALAIAAIALLAPGSAPANEADLALVPMPAGAAAVDGAATLSSRWAVRVPAGSAADSFAASLLIEDVRVRHGWKWPIADRPGPAVVLRFARPAHRATPLWNRQGYELEVWPDSIVIRAPTETGRYYGVQTLRQLVRGAPHAVVPGLVLRDGPSFAWRGLSDDISRGQMSTLEDFRRTIATLGYYKANVYQLYIEDVFEFAGAPDVGLGRSRLSPADLSAIVAEGRRHHVEVIPIFQSLGHQQRLLSHPARRALAEVQPVSAAPWRWSNASRKFNWLVQSLFFGAVDDDDRKPWSFAPGEREARNFVKARIRELAAAAPGGWFHIGGDEAFDLGTGLGPPPGAARRGAMVGDYFAELAADLRDQGRRTMVYSDELLADPAGLARLPRDVTVVYWNYRGDGADTALFAIRSAGFARVHVSPGLWDWSAFAPHLSRAFTGIALMTESGAEARAEGVVVASWGDRGAESFKVLNAPGVAFAAEAGWCGAADSAAAPFLARFARVHFGARGRGIAEALRHVGWQEFPNVGWNGRLYHRAPVVKTRDHQWIARMRTLDRDMARARRLFRAEAPAARWNRDQLEYFDHAARRFAFVARRELLLDQLAREPVAAPSRRSRRLETPERRLRSLRDESAAIETQFEKLWRANYRLGALRSNLTRLERQTAALDSLRSAFGS